MEAQTEKLIEQDIFLLDSYLNYRRVHKLLPHAELL